MSTMLGGRYQLVRELGAGGMGRVFQAVDTQTGRAVAAKIMLASSEDSLEALLRFQQEGTVLSTLKHPNIVEVYATFLEEHTSCIVMELLEGQSLTQLLQLGPLPLSRIGRLVRQIIDALTYAHGRGIVHRDIKPDNIMVVGDDHVKVTDFGIARILRTGGTLNTATGTSIGTPLYMAPEQIEGAKVDGRADIYSLGTVMYQMVTGQPPFQGDDPLTVAFKHVHKAPQPLSEIKADIPRTWEALILKALAKDPADRYQSAAALGEALDSLAANGISIPSSPQPPSDPKQRRAVPQPPTTGWHPATVTRPSESTEGQSAALSAERTALRPAVIPLAPQPASSTRLFPWLFALGAGIAVLVLALAGFFVLHSSSGSATATATPRLKPTPKAAGSSLTVVATFGAKGTGRGQFDSPSAVAVDGQGNMYVADTNNNRIQKLSPSGAFLRSWGTKGAEINQCSSPEGIAVDSSGFVYVSDTGNNRIYKLSARLKVIAVWGINNTKDEQFSRPTGITVDATGNLYVADTANNRIQKIATSNGKSLNRWDIAGSNPAGFSGPTAVVVDGQGNLFVTDTGNSRVVELASTSDPLDQSGSGQFSQPVGIGLQTGGTLVVSDRGMGHIVRLKSPHQRLSVGGSEGSGKGQFQAPDGLATDAAGNVYVADRGNNRIQKVTLVGSGG